MAGCKAVSIDPLYEAEQGTEHPGLSVKVLSGDAKHLLFANHLHRLDSCNHRARGRYHPRTLHGPQPPFNVPMVGFDSIICVGAGSVATTTMDSAFTGLEACWPYSGWVESSLP